MNLKRRHNTNTENCKSRISYPSFRCFLFYQGDETFATTKSIASNKSSDFHPTRFRQPAQSCRYGWRLHPCSAVSSFRTLLQLELLLNAGPFQVNVTSLRTFLMLSSIYVRRRPAIMLISKRAQNQYRHSPWSRYARDIDELISDDGDVCNIVV